MNGRAWLPFRALNRPTRLPRALLGMMALVAAVELTLSRYALDFVHTFTYDWAVTGRAARTAAPGCGVLCFGDSLVKFGLVPRVLEQRLGMRAYNLAVCGGQAPSSYFLLRRAIDAGARPRAVVVDFMPHLLSHGPKPNLRQWPELMTAREFVDLTWSARNASLFGSLALSALLPSVRQRREIRDGLLAFCEGTSASSRAVMPAYVRNWQVNLGAQLSPSLRPALGKRFNLDRWEDYPRAWSCNPMNELFVRRFLALAEEHGVAVYWLLPPTRSDIQARRERLGVDAPHERFVRAILRDFPGVTIVDCRKSRCDAASFADPLHLSREGAVALSVALSEPIRAGVERGPANSARWVPLDSAGCAPTNVPIEDIEQSKLALNLTGTRRGP